MTNTSDENNLPAVVDRPDLTALSIGDLLTRLQRQHIENLIALSEDPEGPPNAQVLAQINRFLMDNGVTVLPSEQPQKIIEGHAKERQKLPNFEGRDYNT